MGFIWTLIIGLVVGTSRSLMPGRDSGGFIITMLLGVAGAFTPPGSDRRSAGTTPGRAPGASARWSAP